MPSSTKTFLGCLCLIIFLKASVVFAAYFVFSGSTLRYLDRQSTATKKYFMPRCTLQVYQQMLDLWTRSHLGR